ncbi:hypothetical protein PEX1_060430 [Penicillium expansum]|uniref:Uncharacterized protein n=1 Tax=Penicillium expansum TaxID=27334 RepID=A0A0A2KWP6_PENEN|nr:hypothetical protein PEX2_092560 [Penicillium expansum]KGO41032.1 hypothetical protein PEXP_083950 [Penicillium expansum]KGO58901.1 hypothetical protein PEX2_092560 [Penicillium expansum]KGO72237.1 hypothetical protein PEX1_060430 [Penicillium expansum]
MQFLVDLETFWGPFALFISMKRPHTNVAVPAYYQLLDVLYDVAERKKEFADFDKDIASTVSGVSRSI